MKKIQTIKLSRQELLNEIKFIISLFESIDEKESLLMLGWGCDLSIDDLYKTKKVRIDELELKIFAYEKDNKLRIGSSDIFISSINNDFKFLLCHESDIHFETSEKSYYKTVLKHWMDTGLI